MNDILRIARPIYFVFFCVDITLEKFQSTPQQQQLRKTQVEIDLDTRCSTSFKLHTSVDL